MSNMDGLFPEFKKSLEDLIEDEEGNIPGKKLLMLGTMMVILGSFFSTEALAKHGSHGSHKSHSSHSSGSHGSHNNHGSHGSHGSHESHVSHTSHSNTSSHSNSSYSSEGDVAYSAPSAYRVPGIDAQPVTATEEALILPEVNQNIEMPNGTPTSSIIPSFAVPATTVGAKIDVGEINKPSSTGKIK